MPLTKDDDCGKIEPKLHLGFDQVLKYAYRKGKRTHTEKIVRVCDGVVYILDPATKNQIAVGQAMWVGDTLIMALSVHRES